jgi:hypothetical protein
MASLGLVPDASKNGTRCSADLTKRATKTSGWSPEVRFTRTSTGTEHVSELRARVARFLLFHTYQNRKKYQMTKNYTTRQYIVPNGRKIVQMVIKYNNILHVHVYSKALQNIPKIGFLVWKINHPATLLRAKLSLILKLTVRRAVFKRVNWHYINSDWNIFIILF